MNFHDLYILQQCSIALDLNIILYLSGYKIPKCKTVEDYRTSIDTLPLVDSPEAFGLHPNADITYSTNTANEMLSSIVNIQPKDTGGGGGDTRETIVYRLSDDMLDKLPPDYLDHEVSRSTVV